MFECAKSTPCKDGMYLSVKRCNYRLVLVHQQRRRAVTDFNAHRIIILSSISSTPARKLEAKTGGMERTRLALVIRNSLGWSDARDFPLSLGDFGFDFCDEKTSSGGGTTDRVVVFRFSFFFVLEFTSIFSVGRCFRFLD